MKATYGIFVILLLGLASCSVRPQPINYGSDGCQYCSMTIVDKQHAAQYVTHKGKVFKFDATECMMNTLREVDRESIALYLVNDFETPGELINATEATYLISKNIPSPMGEYLSAFKNREVAERVQAANEGILLTWTELQQRFKDKTVLMQ
ncbi:nitrous oxide reductase accessory protein NosL [Muriicola sp.]|uniref:nitrous oxide reductase accessory protein NosL n=1 Tax=Muriicola sp. TaxID=2020856 RepID=UPI003C70AA55